MHFESCLQNSLVGKYLNSESTVYFLDDETFYYTRKLLFSKTIYAATVIKVTNVALFTLSIIYMM